MADTKHLKVVDGVVVDIPEGVEYVEPEVRELARGIAAEIRKRGHLQLPCPAPAGSVCIVTSKRWKDSFAWGTKWRLAELITGLSPEAIRLDIAPVWVYNDSNPTPVVLARLDAIAEGLVAS